MATSGRQDEKHAHQSDSITLDRISWTAVCNGLTGRRAKWVGGCWSSIVPQPCKPIGGKLTIAHRVLDRAVTEIMLQGARVGARIG